jgi:hypothetical protein
MRNVAIRIVALFLQLTLLAVADHVMGMLIARLFEARVGRCRQLRTIQLLHSPSRHLLP